MDYKPEIHELALIFPAMTDDQFERLAEDIKENGLLEAITLYQGKVIDGVHRFKACQRHNIEPAYSEYTGDNPLAFVIGKNLSRRHLDESQRAMVAAKIANLKIGRPQTIENKEKSKRPIDRVSMSNTQAAKTMNVGEKSVRRAKTIQSKGAPELIAAVESGEVSVSAGEKIAKQPKEKQAEEVKRHKAAKAQKKPGKSKRRTVAIPALNSLSWAESPSQARTKFVSDVGLLHLFNAAPPREREHVLAQVCPVPATAQKSTPSMPIEGDGLGVPEFLRRTK